MREVPIRTVGLLPCHRLDAADHPAFKTLVRGQGDIRQTRSLFRDLLEQQRPFLLTGLPLRPAETILAGLPGGRVEVAASSSGSFSGAYNAHNALQMSVQDFFSYEGRLRLYLAQVPLVFRAEERAAAAAAGSASPSRSCSLARNWARFLRCEVAELTQVAVFIFIVLGFGVFFFLKLPETKNKSYDDIYRIFNKDAPDPSGKVTAAAYRVMTSLSSQNGDGG